MSSKRKGRAVKKEKDGAEPRDEVGKFVRKKAPRNKYSRPNIVTTDRPAIIRGRDGVWRQCTSDLLY